MFLDLIAFAIEYLPLDMVFRKPRRVAVIGAGPAGAIATDSLVKEQAFDTIRVFERQHAAGGTW